MVRRQFVARGDRFLSRRQLARRASSFFSRHGLLSSPRSDLRLRRTAYQSSRLRIPRVAQHSASCIEALGIPAKGVRSARTDVHVDAPILRAEAGSADSANRPTWKEIDV